MTNNVSTFLAELAALMEKYEIDSFCSGSEALDLWYRKGNEWRFINLGDEATPESLFELSKELDK